MPNNTIRLVTGSLNTNNKTVSLSKFNSDYSNIRNLNLSSSIINLSGGSYNYYGSNYTWNVNTNNFSFNSGNSTINFTADQAYFNTSGSLTYFNINFTGTSQQWINCGSNSTFNNVLFSGTANIYGQNGIYNDVVLLKDGNLNSSSTFNNLTLAPGKNYNFANGATFTFNGNLIGTGSPENLINIICSSSYAIFNKATGTICLDYISLQNIHTSGSAYFFAGANSNDLGGNLGWSFTSCSLNPPDTPGNPTSNSPQCNVVTLTAPGSPPAGVVWYWQGISCGTNTNLGSGNTFTATSSGTYYLRAYNPACSCWSSGCGNVSVVVTQSTDRTWLGTISSNWMNGENWSCGSAPNPDNDVFIPAGTPYSPVLNAGMTSWVKSVTLSPGANLTIQR